jgi:hypothetical protein
MQADDSIAKYVINIETGKRIGIRKGEKIVSHFDKKRFTQPGL